MMLFSKKNRRTRFGLLLFCVLLLGGAVFAYWHWFATPTLEPIPELELSKLEVPVQKQIQETVASLDPDHPTAKSYGNLGMTYHVYEFWDQALPCYLNAQRLDPSDFRWPYYLGRVYRERGELANAIDHFIRAENMLPKSLPSRNQQLAALNYWLGVCYLENDQLDPARTCFQKVNSFTSSPGAWLGLGEIASRRDDFLNIFQSLNKAVALMPDSSKIHTQLAVNYRKKGNLKQAEYHAILAKNGVNVDLSPQDPLFAEVVAITKSPTVLCLRGGLAFKAHRYDLAAQHYQKALALDSENLTAQAGLGACLAMKKYHSEAIKHYQKVLQAEPNHVEANCGMGMILAEQEKFKESQDYFEKALAKDPKHRNSHFYLAYALTQLGKNQEAAHHFEEVVKIAPDNQVARLGLIVTQIQSHKYQKAFQELEEGLTLAPDNLKFKLLQARILVTCPEAKYRDGVKGLELAKSIFKAQSHLQNAETLAMAHAENGNFPEAIKIQEAAIKFARSKNQATLLDRLERNLHTYQRRQPCRTPLEGNVFTLSGQSRFE